MKKVLLFLILINIVISCKTVSEGNSSTYNNNKILDTRSDNLKDKADTVKIDSNSIFLFKVLSMLPDSAMGIGHDWSIQERKEEFNNALKGFYVNLGSDGIHSKKIISSNYLYVQVVDSYWQLKLYNMDDSNMVVLAHAHDGDGDEFYVYKLENEKLYPIHDFFPPNYLELFFKKPEFLKEYDKREQPGYFELLLDYELKGDTILVSNYYAKEDSNLFVGNIQILSFDRLIGKMKSKSVYWGTIN